MSDLRALSLAAGIDIDWTDNDGVARGVGEDTQRRVLTALGFDCETPAQVRDSFHRLRGEDDALPSFMTARAHRAFALRSSGLAGRRARIAFEQGGAAEFVARECGDGFVELPAVDTPGYHRLLIGADEITLAVAPARCHTIADAVGDAHIFGVAAQIYGLRHGAGPPGETVHLRGMGSGDFGALAAFAREAARHGAQAIGLSPSHALFAGDLDHYSPYSPSNRLFLNVLLADPCATFDAARIHAAINAAGLDGEARELESNDLIDWPRTGAARVSLLRALFESFVQNEFARPGEGLSRDFAEFRARGGAALEAHAQFEALHGREFARDFTKWHWRTWPAELRTPGSAALRAHARECARDVSFHVFAQWLAARSLARAQREACGAGMKIGLIGDLAVGLNDGGSQAWQRPNDLLQGLSIGAPPDALAPKGQDWGLAAFSPRALRRQGFAPFIATLRAVLRDCGGVRIDHVMGLARLWLIPEGAGAGGGAYLRYPLDDLLALVALESARHRAIVVGEDLGTVPHGFREKLAENGLAGLRVLLFERDGEDWRRPEWYPREAVAMTTTHDTATFAGWQRGRDIEVRDACGQLPPGQSRAAAEAQRAFERTAIDRAFSAAGCGVGDMDDAERACDDAVDFIARSAAQLVLIPLEDIAGLIEQPNLPGTTTEHPNWRRRYPAAAQAMPEGAAAAGRLRRLRRHRFKPAGDA